MDSPVYVDNVYAHISIISDSELITLQFVVKDKWLLQVIKLFLPERNARPLPCFFAESICSVLFQNRNRMWILLYHCISLGFPPCLSKSVCLSHYPSLCSACLSHRNDHTMTWHTVPYAVINLALRTCLTFEIKGHSFLKKTSPHNIFLKLIHFFFKKQENHILCSLLISTHNFFCVFSNMFPNLCDFCHNSPWCSCAS